MAWNEAVVTAAGMELLARCLTGGNVVISRAVGGESASAALSLMALKSINEPCHDMNLFRLKNEGGRIVVNLRVQNKGLAEEYTLRQIGLFARLDDEESDVLFAVIQDSIGEVIPKESDNPEFLTEFDFVIPVANAEKIQVEITPQTFAAAEDIAEVKGEIAEHTSDKSNPHGVTKAQVGLGNVPNVATNDQTVTYTAADLGELASGEKLGVAFGKIAKAVKDVISHIADNVRHITAAERTAWNSKAAGDHTHTAAEVGALTNIKIGTVTTGAAGSNASATASTSGTVTTLNLTIPKGDTGAQGVQGATGAAAGFGTPTATVDANVGTPSVTVTASGANTAKVFNFVFKNLKGAKGDKGDTGATGAQGATGATGAAGAAAGFGTPTATVDANVGTPSVTVTASGANTAKVFNFAFKNLKGATGAKGDKGDKGDTGAQGAAGAAGATPTIKVAAGTNINAVGTPSVTASTSGTTTTLTFNYLKGAAGAAGTNATTTAVATQSANGLMSAADKAKLDSIKGDAIPVITEGSKSVAKNGTLSIDVPYASGGKKVVVSLWRRTTSSFTGYDSVSSGSYVLGTASILRNLDCGGTAINVNIAFDGRVDLSSSILSKESEACTYYYQVIWY